MAAASRAKTSRTRSMWCKPTAMSALCAARFGTPMACAPGPAPWRSGRTAIDAIPADKKALCRPERRRLLGRHFFLWLLLGQRRKGSQPVIILLFCRHKSILAQVELTPFLPSGAGTSSSAPQRKCFRSYPGQKSHMPASQPGRFAGGRCAAETAWSARHRGRQG